MTNPHNGECHVHKHIPIKLDQMERVGRISISVTLTHKNKIRPNRTRVLYEPRKEMRVLESVVATVLLTIIACNHIPKQTERKTIPIVDKNNEIHIYRSSHPLRLDNDYALYCMEHHIWETIQVRYKPNQLSKLRSEEYTVRKHPKSS